MNGVVVLEASAAKLTATYWQIDGSQATTSYYERPFDLLRRLVPKRIEAASEHADAGREPQDVRTV